MDKQIAEACLGFLQRVSLTGPMEAVAFMNVWNEVSNYAGRPGITMQQHSKNAKAPSGHGTGAGGGSQRAKDPEAPAGRPRPVQSPAPPPETWRPEGGE